MSKHATPTHVVVRTIRGTQLTLVGRHPEIPDLVSVITDDGWKTTVQVSALEPSDELRACMEANPGPSPIPEAA